MAAFGALAPDRSGREAALRAQHTWFDQGGEIEKIRIRSIADLRDPAERMRQIHALRRKSPAARYEQLKGLFARGDEVDVSDLRPAPVARLLQHLRLPTQTSTAGFAEAMKEAAAALIREEGFMEAFVRLCSLPVAMPRPLTAAYLQMAPSEQKDWVRSAVSVAASPISRLHLFGLVFRSDEDWASGEARKLAEWFFSEEGSLAFDAFVEILLWSVYEIESQGDTESISPGIILAAGWSHASRLHNTVREYMPDQNSIEFFRQFSRPRPSEMFWSKLELLGDVAYPRRLSYAGLLLHGLSLGIRPNITSPLIPFLKENVLKLCFFEHKGVSVPRLEVMRDPNLHYNALGSFLGGDRGEALAPLLGPEDSGFFGSAQIQRETEAALSAVLATPKEEAQWMMLHALSGARPAAGSVRDKLRAVISGTVFTDLLSFDTSVLQLALCWLAMQARLLGEPDLEHRVKQQLISLAGRCAIEERRGALDRDCGRADTLLEVARCAALSANAPRAAARQFAELLLAILGAWPWASGRLWSTVSQIAFRLRADLVVELSPVILRLRQLAQ